MAEGDGWDPVDDAGQSSGGRRAPQRTDASRTPLTDELVRQVADRVYAMLKRDAALERELKG